MVTLRGQVSTAEAVAGRFLSCKTHLWSGRVPLCFQMGPVEALAWDQPERTRLRLESSPAAERATSELPGGSSSPSVAELGPSALPGSLPHAAGFLPAAPVRMCQRSWWLRNLSAPRVAPQDPPSFLPTRAHPTHPHPWHPGKARGRGKAAVLTSAWPSSSLSTLLALSVLHWAREKQGKKLSSDACAARLQEQCSGTEVRPQRHSRHGGGSASSAGA